MLSIGTYILGIYSKNLKKLYNLIKKKLTKVYCHCNCQWNKNYIIKLAYRWNSLYKTDKTL